MILTRTRNMFVNLLMWLSYLVEAGLLKHQQNGYRCKGNIHCASQCCFIPKDYSLGICITPPAGMTALCAEQTVSYLSQPFNNAPAGVFRQQASGNFTPPSSYPFASPLNNYPGLNLTPLSSGPAQQPPLLPPANPWDPSGASPYSSYSYLPNQLVTTASQGTTVTGAFVYVCNTCETKCCCGTSCCDSTVCNTVASTAASKITGTICTGCLSLCCCGEQCCDSSNCGFNPGGNILQAGSLTVPQSPLAPQQPLPSNNNAAAVNDYRMLGQLVDYYQNLYQNQLNGGAGYYGNGNSNNLNGMLGNYGNGAVPPVQYPMTNPYVPRDRLLSGQQRNFYGNADGRNNYYGNGGGDGGFVNFPAGQQQRNYYGNGDNNNNGYANYPIGFPNDFYGWRG